MNLDKIRQNFKRLIAENLNSAIIELEKTLDPNSSLFGDILNLRRRHLQATKDFQKGIISNDERMKQYDKIGDAIISIVNEISERDLKEMASLSTEMNYLSHQLSKIIDISTETKNRIANIEHEIVKNKTQAQKIIDLNIELNSKLNTISVNISSKMNEIIKTIGKFEKAQNIEVIEMQLGGILVELQTVTKTFAFHNSEVIEMQLGGILVELQNLNKNFNIANTPPKN